MTGMLSNRVNYYRLLCSPAGLSLAFMRSSHMASAPKICTPSDLFHRIGAALVTTLHYLDLSEFCPRLFPAKVFICLILPHLYYLHTSLNASDAALTRAENVDYDGSDRVYISVP